jgi:hypothetical protein
VKLISLIIITLLSISTQASPLEELVGSYKGQNCKVVILDLKMSNPIGYNINFPDWDYQIALFKRGKLVKETIKGPFDDNEVRVNEDEITIYFNKGDEWSSSQYKFQLNTQSNKLSLFKKNFFGKWRHKASCSF